MKKQHKILLSCMTVLLLVCGMALPCFGAISDMSDTIVVDRVYYTSSSNYSSVSSLVSNTYSPGDTKENNRSFLNLSVLPNYFYEQFNVYSSSGLPIADSGHSYSFTMSNFYIYIDSPKGISYLSSVDRISISLYYADGTNSGYFDLEEADFVYSSNTNSHYIEFAISPNKPVLRYHLRYYFDIADFGLSFISSSTDISDYIFYIGSRSFIIDREEVFPTANSNAFDNYNDAEQGALDASKDGIDEAANAISYVGNLISPGKSVYSGILFFGNLMRDFTVYIPDLSNILWISLGLGLCIVIVGGITAVFVRRSNSEARSSKKGG